MDVENKITILTPDGWTDYALLDSGNGKKLERFGAYTFARPEAQALWRPKMSLREWQNADGIFTASSEEGNGKWELKTRVPARWEMGYGKLRFFARATRFRHLGVFPEQAVHWNWIFYLVAKEKRPINPHTYFPQQSSMVLSEPDTHILGKENFSQKANPRQNQREISVGVKILDLFGYTGIATLSAGLGGAEVTYVDASPKAMQWARENQTLSGLAKKPIRWIADDALKFIKREVRRGARYDGFIIDPPKFGRGPKGEIWDFYTSLPPLLNECRSLFSDNLLFVALTSYAMRMSSVSIRQMLEEMVHARGGEIESGELAVQEENRGRILSQAIFARWTR
ncbi:MAG: 23S rRNA (cytosine1962-C5)-methyltransferase [Parcubacteria group bacterium Gr01-1014_33]|nr:MAG: 23S rRNA (cytosine1962-C5)-methyltransferase [Parcubacteria group bacterium Gr01-1014_33]